MDDLNVKLLSELKTISEELKIKGVSKLSKQDLIYKILDEQAIAKPKKSEKKPAPKPASKSTSKSDDKGKVVAPKDSKDLGKPSKTF